MGDLFIGVDAGTTRVKALAVDPTGTVVAEAALPTPWQRSGAEAELDALELMDVVAGVLTHIAESEAWPRGAQARGIGVTSMAEAGVLIGPTGDPVAPTIAFHDPRGSADQVRRAVSVEDFHGHVGMRLNNKPSVSKILWMQEHIAGAKSAECYLSVAEWIVHRLGGERVSEKSLVSRTGLFDVVDEVPWGATLELVGDLLPGPIVIAGDDCGSATVVPASMRGATLTATGMDHLSAAFACGAATTGALFDSMGTAEALIRFAPGPLPRSELTRLSERDIAVLWSVIPDHVVVLGALVTGLSLERISRLLGLDTLEQRQAVAADAVACATQSISVRDVSHTGLSIGGIDDDASPAALWSASVRHLVSLGTDLVDFIEDHNGARNRTVLAGGWVHDPMVLAAKQEALGDFDVSDVDEAGALGAAMFGAIASGAMRRPGPDEQPQWP